MSRDIYVQDIPASIDHVQDIPADFVPQPLPVTYDEIVSAIRRVTPSADFTDPEWALIDGEGYSIEVGIRRDEPITSFAFHCRASGRQADLVVAEILEALDLRAFDPDDETGIFRHPRSR